LPVTIVENIQPIPLGDATAGEAVYDGACRRCHGEAVTGAGNILDALDDDYVLPSYATENYPVDFPGVAPGLVVIEKIRHGRFFDIGGSMAPFSTETLTDADIGDLLAFLGLPSE
jgi:thiosulfate dehydrogenase